MDPIFSCAQFHRVTRSMRSCLHRVPVAEPISLDFLVSVCCFFSCFLSMALFIAGPTLLPVLLSLLLPQVPP